MEIEVECRCGCRVGFAGSQVPTAVAGSVLCPCCSASIFSWPARFRYHYHSARIIRAASHEAVIARLG